MMSQATSSTTTTSAAPLLRMSGIVKRFGPVTVLNDVTLTAYAGKVTALIGENGAGKSTLVKILTGIYKPDAGEVLLGGEALALADPHAARAAGITAIHQETVMFEELSVTENIFIGHHLAHPRTGLVDWAAMRARAVEILRRLDVGLNPDTPVRELSIAERHFVEIARALSHDARVVIMDEPTAALSRREIEELYRIVGQLKREGKAILFISHKFDEIFAIADSYTVLRDGRFIAEGPIAEVDERRLIAMMVGRELDQVFPKRPVPIGDIALQVEGLSHPTEFADISFAVRKGEILGFYGLVGAGRTEAMQGLFGITRRSGGTIALNGQALTISSPADAIAAGIVYVPEDRQAAGAVLPMSILQNITLPLIERIVGGRWLKRARELAVAKKFAERLQLRAAHYDQPVGQLSGGNQQKVVIAKWLATNPAVIILDEPTKGIDVGSKAAVHEFMVELAGQGLAVILVSSELPEILGMADRIIVMHEGHIARTFARADATPENIVAAATGSEVA
jgi:rhamnose transport system ATP-binding protein